jgi:hypothetical protein
MMEALAAKTRIVIHSFTCPSPARQIEPAPQPPPPIASEVVDTEGVALVRRWIESLDEWQAEVSRAHINGVSAE